jgi:AcrR family transcriptional regulator
VPDLDTRQQIIEVATKDFLHYGFKNVTVDEIARSAGISKKTLYQEFSKKDDLVLASAQFYNEKHWDEMIGIMDRANNAIEELVGIFSHMAIMFKGMNPVCFVDLQRYYTRAYKYMEEFKKTKLHDCIKDNLDRGIQEGLFREDIDTEIVARYRMESVFIILHLDIFPKKEFDLVEVSKQTFELYMFGISTLKGHKLITKYLENLK